MYPTTYEEQILKVLVLYHYLTVDQVMLATGHTSKRNSQGRLKHLTDEGYLWRIHRRTTEQNLPLKPAYTISAKAKKYLEEQGTIVLPSRSPSPYLLDHALAINDVLIRVSLLPKLYSERFKLLALKHDRDLKHEALKLPVVPDGFFEVADLSERKSYPTLLEVDLDTEERLRWQDKVEKYLTIFGDEAQRAFGFRHPDILCVTKAHHVHELKKWTEAVIKRREFDEYEKLFYFTSLPNEIAPDAFFLSPRFLQGGSSEPVHLFTH